MRRARRRLLHSVLICSWWEHRCICMACMVASLGCESVRQTRSWQSKMAPLRICSVCRTMLRHGNFCQLLCCEHCDVRAAPDRCQNNRVITAIVVCARSPAIRGPECPDFVDRDAAIAAAAVTNVLGVDVVCRADANAVVECVDERFGDCGDRLTRRCRALRC